jgi:hypothetical protein
MVAHLTGELGAAREQAERFRKEAEANLPLRHEIGLAEARALRQQAQNRELVEALEAERQRAANARTERAAAQERLDALEATAGLSDELAALRARHDAMLTSLSWALTRPLRVLAKRWRALARPGRS